VQDPAVVGDRERVVVFVDVAVMVHYFPHTSDVVVAVVAVVAGRKDDWVERQTRVA
jgi:hypothetical protein